MKLPHRIKSFYSKIKKIGFNKKKIKYDFQYFFLVDTYKKLNKINDSAKSIKNHLLLNVREKIIYSFTNFQNFLEKISYRQEDETALQQAVFWGRTISWSLMAGTAFGISWISIAKTEEVVVAFGKLEPSKGVVDVQMPIQGIAKEILIKEGDTVEKGQVLIKLDSEITEANIYSQNENLKNTKIIVDNLENLVKEGAVSRLQYLEQKNRYLTLQSEIIKSKVNLKYQEILAPTSGTVFDLKPWGAGYVARTSEPILKIVPEDTLIAKIEISSNKIGFVKLGKLADISIDSFPSSDFGVLEGKITHIGSDALPPDPQNNKGFRYPAKIEIERLTFKARRSIVLRN